MAACLVYCVSRILFRMSLAFLILPDTLLGPHFVLSYAKPESTTELTP